MMNLHVRRSIFSEHPLLFIGYSAFDPDIQAILADIDECLPQAGMNGGVIPNIFLLERHPDMPVGYSPAKEKAVSIGDGRSVRIKAIETADFSWVFAAFGANQPLNAVSPKLLRALLSRSYDLVRYDIPRKTVQADFKMLEGGVESDESFAKLFGITTINEGSANNAGFPYTLTDLATRITKDENAHWTSAIPYVETVSKQLGINIRLSDNRYHSKIKAGCKSYIRRYSHEMLDIALKINAGENYSLKPI